MTLDKHDDPWSGDNWTCQGCQEPLSQIVDGPGATLCFPCRNPEQSVDALPFCCDECGEAAQVRILTHKGMLCVPCGNQVLAVKRQAALNQAAREDKRFRERVLRSKHAEKETVK